MLKSSRLVVRAALGRAVTGTSRIGNPNVAFSRFGTGLRRCFADQKRNTDNDIIIEANEPAESIHTSDTTTHEFQAETRKLLHIVAKSIYTDSEVFVRELLSNASDALEKEKYRQLQSSEENLGDPLQISVVTNESKRQITIFDTGIGMTKKDLIDNLGTIAKSGSKAFIDQIKDSGKGSADIIGQFGVGFYSSFIVGHTVEVISKRAGEDAYVWVSDGSGQFSVSKADNVNFDRGTKVVIHLTNENIQFSRKLDVEQIIKKYSNFISYPIFLNGEKVNLTQPIWGKDKASVTDTEYKQLWEHTAKTKLPFKYKLHYSVDVPMQLKAVLYIPASHSEKMGYGREDPNVALYSRKVLIKDKCSELLPAYLRFVKGVVDCEDLPLNISRENYQDSALITRIRSLLTKRIIKQLNDENNKDPLGFAIWSKEFASFIGEGIISDKDNAEQLIKLLRFRSTHGDNVSIDDYLEKVKPGQQNIYYTVAGDQESANKSPFMEPFNNSKTPVLFLSNKIDEFFFMQMEKYKGFKFTSIDSSYEEIQRDVDSGSQTKKPSDGLTEEEIGSLCMWIKNELQPVVSQVKVSKRINNIPALIVSPFPSTMKSYIAMMDASQLDQFKNNHTMEINPNHKLIIGLNKIRKIDLPTANAVVRQLLDNTLLSCGLLLDPTDFVTRVNKLLETSVDNAAYRKSIDASKQAHREEVPEPSQQQDKEAILKEAFSKMKQNVRDEGNKATVDIGPDGKPIVR